MSDEGVFAVHRGIFKHPIFADEPYTEREAWMWLLASAAWRPTRARVGKIVVALERGQCAFAGRFMATKWKWPEARVRRFLKRLKSDAMIVVQTTRNLTQITICNYDDYQFQRRTDDAQIDAQPDAQVTHKRRKEEEDNKIIKEDIVRLPFAEPSLVGVPRKANGVDPLFLAFYAAYPRRQSKQDALKAYGQVRKAGISHEKIMAGLERAKRDDRRFREAQYTPLPASWLRAGGFDDEPNVQAQDWKQAVFS